MSSKQPEPFRHGDRVRMVGAADTRHNGYLGTVDQPEGAETREGQTWVVFDLAPEDEGHQDVGWYRTDGLELVSE